MNTGRLIFGIAIGAAAGALLGILFAPDKGSETRRKLYERGDNYTRNLKNRFGNLWGKGKANDFASESEFSQETATSPSI
ncbi:MAG TPA: YtxH domain-containing protein [Bacteroidales bacterium]|nr:YtxH domain-containing protein [Bacteroidales bacterium]